MILLLGGTSDTSPIAVRLAREGYRVLVSKATEVPLAIEAHPNIENRTGPLNARDLAELIDRRRIHAIVDATHPYAVEIRATAGRVAQERGLPYLSFVRPAAVDPATPGVEFAADHSAAAALAFCRGRPVLLTTGTKNLGPYVEQARRTGLPLVVRVLDYPRSLEACRRAGIRPEHVLASRGPFSVEDNRRHLRAFGIGVLVAKDSGVAGGTAEKLEAAQAEGCGVVILARPDLGRRRVFADVDAIVEALAHGRLNVPG
jgi:precorrin-6A/cobalt-precorrin-6A reductase